MSQGVTKPTGFFDPLKFSEGKEVNEVAKLREAELKHGRWAMISALSIPLLESKSHLPAIHNFDNLSNDAKIGIVFAVLAGEATTILKGWKNPYNGGFDYFKMKEDYQPGDLGLNTKYSDELINKELNNGRLAMIASIGMIAQELVTNKSLF
jgi:hypothetical protein